MPKHLTKIDRQGNYSKFPGLSVVAAIKNEDIALWTEVHDCISKYSGAYYAPLPITSYHMTAFELYTKMEHASKPWRAFIKSQLPFLSQIRNSLQENPIKPNFTLKTTRFTGAIQLCVTLPIEQQEKIHNIAKALNLEKRVPAVFHITLAYQYRGIDSDNEQLIQKQIQTNLNEIFTRYSDKVELEQPKLCYFNDMTASIPWDGQNVPFERPSAHSHHCFKWFRASPSQDPSADRKLKL